MSIPSKEYYATIWEVEDKGSYASGRMSTSRKDKDGKYINTNWFVRFLKNAYEPSLELKRQDRIRVLGSSVSQEGYIDKDGNRAYPKNPIVAIFAFEMANKRDSGDNAEDNTGPEVENDSSSDSDELPF